MVSVILHKNPLIFFVYPDPKGSEENQFTPLGAGVNKLIFKRLTVSNVLLTILIKYSVPSKTIINYKNNEI